MMHYGNKGLMNDALRECEGINECCIMGIKGWFMSLGKKVINERCILGMKQSVNEHIGMNWWVNELLWEWGF